MRDIADVYKLKERSRAAALHCKDKSRTQQSDLKDSDMNEIVRKFGLTATIPVGVRMPEYGDFTGVGDFRSAMDAVRGAQESFMALPAALRARFSNDPQMLMDFLAKDENREEAVKLGMVNKPADVVKVPGVDTPIRVVMDAVADVKK